MNKQTIEQIDFLAHTDGFLRDYILSVVIDSIEKELGETEFMHVNKNHIHSALILNKLAPCSLKKFARTLRLSKSAASALIDRMVAEHIIERTTNPDNRREVLLSLTPGFYEHTQRVHKRLLEWFAGLIDEIGEEAFEKWHAVMTQINHILLKRLKENNERF